MEDRDQIQPDEDVEAHRRGGKHIKATDEGSESGSDDFELHRRRASAVDEGGEGDDDVELHRKGKLLK